MKEGSSDVILQLEEVGSEETLTMGLKWERGNNPQLE